MMGVDGAIMDVSAEGIMAELSEDSDDFEDVSRIKVTGNFLSEEGR